MWCIYTMEYYSVIKEEWNNAFAEAWMDLEIIILSEVRQTKTNITFYHLCVESKKKKDTIELFYKTEIYSQK